MSISAPLLSLLIFLSAGSAEDWPCWRGPGGSGVSDAFELPLDWSDERVAAWRTPVPGKGNSSPIVVGDRVFLTTSYEDAADRRTLDRTCLIAAFAGVLLFGLAGWRHRRTSAPGTGGRFSSAFSPIAGLAVMGALALTLTRDVESALGRSGTTWYLIAAVGALIALECLRRVLFSPGSWLLRGLSLACLLGAGGILFVGLPARYMLTGVAGALWLATLFVAAPRAPWEATTVDLDRRIASFLGVTAVLVAAVTFVVPGQFWSASGEEHVWSRSSMLLTMGLAAAAMAFPTRSRGRAMLAVFLLIVSLALVFLAPTYSDVTAVPGWKRWVAVAPGLAAAAWMGFAALSGTRSRPGWRPFALAGACVVIPGLVFVRANWVQPGLVTRHAVIALDARDGRLLWHQPVHDSTSGRIGFQQTSHATPTPCADQDGLVAYFGSATVALDLDGNLQWKREDPQFVPTAVYGAGSSPVLVGDRVLIMQEREREHEVRPSRVECLDRKTGDTLWSLEPEDQENSYGTPIVLPSPNGLQAVVASWQMLVSYDVTTGARLWTHAAPIKETVTSPVYADGTVFYAGGSAQGATLALELDDTMQPTRTRWLTRRSTPSCSSPVLYRGALYTVSDNGMLSCLDPKTGRFHWRERLGGGKYLASLIACRGRLLVLDDEGHATIVRADPDTFHVLARHDLGEGVIASPAVAGGSVYVRTAGHLVCVRESRWSAGP